MLTRSIIELELQGKLDIVGARAVLVVVKRVVENGEHALGRDRVGRVGEDGAQHVPALRGVTRRVQSGQGST